MGKRLVARAKGADDDVESSEPRPIPIDLLPLLAPYKKHGKLSLRVERLPQQTRLSAGTRNSDGSWSLTRDELEDLEYLVPDGVEGAKSLSVRVVSLTAGSTLAVLDYPLDADGPAIVEGRSDVAREDVLVERLRDELTRLKASLAERDKALAAAPRADAALAEAETRWATELDARLSAEAARATMQLEQARRLWDTQQSERLAKLEARAQEMAAEARASALNEARETTLLAERAWKAEEAVRFAAAEAQWREQLAKVSAEAEARVASVAAGDRQSDAELRAVREQLAAAQATLAARDATLAAANDAAARAAREAQEALAKAQNDWAAAEEARFTAAEAQWRETSAKAVAEAHAQADAARGDQGEAVRGLREQVSALQSTLAERDAALAQAQEATAHAARDAQYALAKAQSAWKADEAARLAAAEVQWRATSATAVAEAHAQVDAVRGDQGEAMRALREQVNALQATLAARDAALAAATKTSDYDDQVSALKAAVAERDAALKRAEDAAAEARVAAKREIHEALSKAEAVWKAEAAARSAAADEHVREVMPAAVESDKDAELRRLREKAATLEAKLIKANKAAEDDQLKWQREAQEAISRATKEWIAKEASRRASTEAEVRKELGAQLMQATSRYEAAEAALAQIRLVGGQTDGTRKSIELDAARAALARREADVFRLRNELDALRDAQHPDAEAPVAAAAPGRRLNLRDVGIAAAIGVATVVAYTFVDGLMSSPPPAPVVARVVEAPAPPPPVVVRTAVLSLDAPLRAGPSTKVGIVAPLDKGVAVTIVEERGEWIRVRAAAAEGKPLREGWVKVSQLKDITPTTPLDPQASP